MALPGPDAESAAANAAESTTGTALLERPVRAPQPVEQGVVGAGPDAVERLRRPGPWNTDMRDFYPGGVGSAVTGIKFWGVAVG